jgi:hypothetical protein
MGNESVDSATDASRRRAHLIQKNASTPRSMAMDADFSETSERIAPEGEPPPMVDPLEELMQIVGEREPPLPIRLAGPSEECTGDRVEPRVHSQISEGSDCDHGEANQERSGRHDGG